MLTHIHKLWRIADVLSADWVIAIDAKYRGRCRRELVWKCTDPRHVGCFQYYYMIALVNAAIGFC